MSTSRGESFGVAKKNELVELGRFESQGPADVILRSMSANGVAVLRVEKNDGTYVATSKDTAVSGEDTSYTGNGSTRAFSSEVLNNLPLIPGTVEIKDAASVYDLVDGGDGKFYTDDDDRDEAGTIDYFTGAMTLAYPVGKAPDSGNMLANYSYQDTTVAKGGQRTFHIASIQQDETLVAKAAGDAEEGVRLRAEFISTWE